MHSKQLIKLLWKLGYPGGKGWKIIFRGYLKTVNGEVPVVIGEETSGEFEISSLENPGGLLMLLKIDWFIDKK
ncbi:hypothetical protein ACDX66_00870 [Peribacillus frigoritolerans]